MLHCYNVTNSGQNMEPKVTQRIQTTCYSILFHMHYTRHLQNKTACTSKWLDAHLMLKFPVISIIATPYLKASQRHICTNCNFQAYILNSIQTETYIHTYINIFSNCITIPASTTFDFKQFPYKYSPKHKPLQFSWKRILCVTEEPADVNAER